MRQVKADWQLSDCRLQDVGRRGCSAWLEPASVLTQERRFFLCAGERYSEILVLAEAKRGRLQIAEQSCDGVIVDRLAAHRSGGRGVFAFGQELHRADAIASYGAQKIIG